VAVQSCPFLSMSERPKRSIPGLRSTRIHAEVRAWIGYVVENTNLKGIIQDSPLGLSLASALPYSLACSGT
jgi:hypothetical protein